MSLKIGIVGLPNAGKSTLFNALLKKQVALAANYPFATIEPNVGIVEVPDDRLPKLTEVVKTNKIVPAAVEFIDIAGLVKGASTGEGLGNKFLAHIREVAAIAHVVRVFEDPNVVHVGPKIDPKSDMETIEAELILADLQTLEKQLRPNKKLEKEEIFFYDTVDLLKEKLNKAVPARDIFLSENQLESIKSLNLLTLKPVIFVCNLSEKQLEKPNSPDYPKNSIYLSAKLESEVVVLNEADQKEYLKQYGLEESGLNRLIKKAYETLGLISFLTAGEKEVRAWTIKKGTLAPAAAGVVHTDFEKHFIKAEVVSFETFIELGGWAKCREVGKVTLGGKDYEMKDGDVVDFKVGV